MLRKYQIKNLREVSGFRTSPDKLYFQKSGKRITKKQARRAGEAVAFLKGIKWLTPTNIKIAKTEEMVVDGDKLEQFIYELFIENRRYGMRDSLVVMGSVNFSEFSRGAMAKSPIIIPMADFQCNHYQPEYMGIKIVVLPWMDGIVLVPKEFFPIERQLVPSGIMLEKRQELAPDIEGGYGWDDDD